MEFEFTHTMELASGLRPEEQEGRALFYKINMCEVYSEFKAPEEWSVDMHVSVDLDVPWWSENIPLLS
ncbi:hypothetical protein Taro_028553 [Colocasia esculenta]|uniref:Uncharacterized protein n=1 Tax=Colocasia esculenta TaxID=4460 RepID=A0A843VHJ8_COLES|nr:hypothetical protein [Colocasia esculenta]